MAKKTIVTLETIASQLVQKNPALTTIVEDNDKSYKLLEPLISTRLCSAIAKREGFYVPRNKLIWAVIDNVKGTSEGLDY